MVDAVTEQSCIFCKIVGKESPATIVYEDRYVLAFLDIYPQNDGHTLVVLKKHYATIYEVPDVEVARLYKVVKKVACAVKKGVNSDGISVTQHNEAGAGQDIFHVHVHVIPRYEGQRLRRIEELPEANRKKLEEIANKIRPSL
jgi:histidine triad (HIT) family protein